MSDRTISTFSIRAAQLAAQLAREPGGHTFTALEIARHATEIVDTSERARQAVEEGKSAERHYRAAAKLLLPYGAQVVENGDPLGVVLGVRFASNSFRAGFNDVLHVS